MVRVHVGLLIYIKMQTSKLRINKSKKIGILYIEDLSPANKVMFNKGKLSFYDLDIRMFKGGRRNLEIKAIPKGYSIVFTHNNKTRLLVFNK